MLDTNLSYCSNYVTISTDSSLGAVPHVSGVTVWQGKLYEPLMAMWRGRRHVVCQSPRCHFHHITLHKSLSQLPDRIKTSFHGHMATHYPNLSLFAAFFSGLVFLLSLNTLHMFSSPGISSPPHSTVSPTFCVSFKDHVWKVQTPRRHEDFCESTSTSSTSQCLKLAIPVLTWLPHFWHLHVLCSQWKCAKVKTDLLYFFPSPLHPLPLLMIIE